MFLNMIYNSSQINKYHKLFAHILAATWHHDDLYLISISFPNSDLDVKKSMLYCCSFTATCRRKYTTDRCVTREMNE